MHVRNSRVALPKINKHTVNKKDRKTEPEWTSLWFMQMFW